MLDRMLDHLQSLRERPVWTPPTAELIEKWKNTPVPMDGIGEEAAFEEFCREILPHGNGSYHPRFLGWVQGTGIPLAMMADMLASGLNSHLAGFHTAPKWIELEVIRWVSEILTSGHHQSGLLTSGGSLANILALQVARCQVKDSSHQDEENARASGMKKTGSWPRLYASDQTHGWIEKGVELLGLGRESIHRVASHADGTIQLDALQAAIEEDRRRGDQPWCLCANVGTVHTGAIDDLDRLARIAKEQELWFHIDGAFGGLAVLVPEYRARLSAMSEADSIAVDLHKWFYLPFDIGCMLVREESKHLATFASSQTYMQMTDRGLLAGGVPLADRGIELTRSFRALKAWMCIQAYGVQRFADCIESNIEQARELARMIDRHPRLERLAPVPLNIVCFRYVPLELQGVEDSPDRSRKLDHLNQELLLRLQEGGVAVLSSTLIDGRLALRAAFTNHRTRRDDLGLILDEIDRIGTNMTSTMQ